MGDREEITKHLFWMLDVIERLYREKRVAVTMLYQAGISNVETLLAENANRPDVQAALDEELRHLQGLKLKLMRLLQSGKEEFQYPPSRQKPN